MPRTGERGGPQTRARISHIATTLFVEKGFDAVTVAEVAREAGVSSVTVFNHFPRKEDLFLDRGDEAVALLHAAVRDRTPGVDVLDSLHAATLHLFETGHALAAVGGGGQKTQRVIAYFRTVAVSPALIGRAREIAAELERTLADDLERDADFDGDARLFAAFFIAGYTTVMTENARRLISGESADAVAADHPARLDRLFDALRTAAHK